MSSHIAAIAVVKVHPGIDSTACCRPAEARLLQQQVMFTRHIQPYRLQSECRSPRKLSTTGAEALRSIAWQGSAAMFRYLLLKQALPAYSGCCHCLGTLPLLRPTMRILRSPQGPKTPDLFERSLSPWFGAGEGAFLMKEGARLQRREIRIPSQCLGSDAAGWGVGRRGREQNSESRS